MKPLRIKRKEQKSTVVKLSVCMIVKNEEKFLPGALESVKDVADEIIVVDTGSTDNTIEIAESHGAKVYEKPWNDDFAEARNESLKHATGQWVLIMDADERVPEDMHDNLRALLVDVEQFLSYSIYIQSRKEIGDLTEFSGHHIVRLFRKTPETKFYGAVHEQVYPSQGSVQIPKESFYLIHLGYADTRFVQKKQTNRNIPIIKKQLEEAKEKNESVESFYSYYMGTVAETPSERMRFFEEAIEKGVSPERAPHVQASILEIARHYHNIKKYKEGLDFAEEKLENHPFFGENAVFLDTLGILYMYNKKYDLAIETFEKILNLPDVTKNLFTSIQKERVGSWGTCLNLVLAHKQIGNEEKAKVYAEKAIELYEGEDKEPIISRIEIMLNSQDVSHEYFSWQNEDAKSFTRSQVKNLSNYYLRQGAPDKALLLQHQNSEQSDVESQAYLLAIQYIERNELESAEKVFEAVSILFPDSHFAKLGMSYLHLLQKDEAEREHIKPHLENTHSIIEDKLALYICLSFSFMEEAKRFAEAIKSAGEHDFAELRLALIDEKAGRIQEAIERLKKLVEKSPGSFEGYIQLGNILLGQGGFAEAEVVFATALKFGRTDWYPYYGYSLSLAGQNKIERAKQALSMAGRLSSGNPNVLNLMELINQQQALHTSSQ